MTCHLRILFTDHVSARGGGQILAPEEEALLPAGAHPRRRQQFAAGRLAAKLAAREFLSVSPRRAALQPDELGRPILQIDGQARPEVFVSITHSGSVAAAAVSNGPIGIDIEPITPRAARLSEVALKEEERGELQTLAPWARPVEATFRWCAREAYAKWTGRGLREPYGTEQWDTVHLHTERFCIDATPYALALVTSRATSVEAAARPTR